LVANIGAQNVLGSPAQAGKLFLYNLTLLAPFDRRQIRFWSDLTQDLEPKVASVFREP
jgi:hypothetical protein